MIGRLILLTVVAGETSIAALDVNLDVAATVNAVAALVIAVSALRHASRNRRRIHDLERTTLPPHDAPADES